MIGWVAGVWPQARLATSNNKTIKISQLDPAPKTFIMDILGEEIMKDKKVVVCGAGGFIGGHLVADLLKQGHTDVRSVDIKPFSEWYQFSPKVENLQLDLQEKDACDK